MENLTTNRFIRIDPNDSYYGKQINAGLEKKLWELVECCNGRAHA